MGKSLIKITDEAYEELGVIVYNTDERTHGPPIEQEQ